jgi:hypothetical protein
MRHIPAAEFPIVTLRQAIDRLASLYWGNEEEALTTADAAKRLGFVELNGPARRVIRALLDYGLVEESAGHRLRMTRLARHLLNAASEFERDKAMVDAADRPPLFRKLNKEFRDRRPDDAELIRCLGDHHLAGEAADDALRIYHRTSQLVSEPRRRLADVLAAVAGWAEHRMATHEGRGKGAARDDSGQDELEPTDLAWE